MNTKNIITSLTASLLDEVKKVMKNEKEKGESKADEKAEHCSEALKGDQHKIDANKNGKVDAHDFKLLRKKKGVAETYATMNSEEEQIDELSDSTLGSYTKKAAADFAARKPKMGYDGQLKKMQNRKVGVDKALNKMYGEEVEDLEELSKGTLGSYIKKAAGSAANKGMEHGTKKAEAEEMDRMMNRHMSFSDKDKVRDIMKTTTKEVEKPREKAMRRLQGIDRAVKKITKEETELTQEEIDFIEATMADLEEGRGRPPKEGSEAWKKRQAEGAAEQDEPRQHPIQQLERIKRDMRGGGDFKHRDGSVHHLVGGDAAKLLDKYHGLKPAEKETMQKEIHASHAGLKKHL
jgi:hypothetical protein